MLYGVMGTIYHSTTDHGINIQYNLWLVMYLKPSWKFRNCISAGTVKAMEALGACYSVDEDGYQASLKGQRY